MIILWKCAVNVLSIVTYVSVRVCVESTSKLLHPTLLFLSVFAKLKKKKRFLTSSCLSLLYPSAWKIKSLLLDGFSWNLIFEHILKSVDKIEGSLNSNKNNRYFTWRLCTFMTISRWIILRMKMFQARVVKKIENTHCRFNIFFSENRAFYEIMWRNTLEPDMPHDMSRMRIAWEITKSTNTHSECVILIAFPRQQWLRECALMLRYTESVCLFRWYFLLAIYTSCSPCLPIVWATKLFGGFPANSVKVWF